MFQPDTTFEVASEQIISKVFEDEVILINLASGVYYSMDGSGGLVWSLVSGGQTFDTTVAEVCAHFDVSTDTAAADLKAVLDRLISESLVTTSTAPSPATEPLPQRPSQKAAYVAPSLNVYDDMAALMALDPPMPGFMDSTWNDPGG